MGSGCYILRWHDAVSGLVCEVELTAFQDFPALEWVVRLRNDGATDTAPVSRFKALNLTWTAPDVMPVLCRAPGILPYLSAWST